MTRSMAVIPIAFDFACVHSELAGSFTSLTQRAMEYPFDSAKLVADQVDLVLGGELYLSGRIDHSQLSGTFKNEDGSGTFALKHIAEVELPYSATDVVIHNGPVSLSGTLYVPHGTGLHPAIVMLQGSGPETRWGVQIAFGPTTSDGKALRVFSTTNVAPVNRRGIGRPPISTHLPEMRLQR
ncbi:MAG: hypothetical protein M3N91_07125 [Pseudomonadota bacterium]|nr:hypothetical protein [Pseudomonadota bacterium]